MKLHQKEIFKQYIKPKSSLTPSHETNFVDIRHITISLKHDMPIQYLSSETKNELYFVDVNFDPQSKNNILTVFSNKEVIGNSKMKLKKSRKNILYLSNLLASSSVKLCFLTYSSNNGKKMESKSYFDVING